MKYPLLRELIRVMDEAPEIRKVADIRALVNMYEQLQGDTKRK